MFEKCASFCRLRIRPRVLQDVSKVDLSTVVFGKKVAIPFGVSPIAMQRMAHPDGEIANVRGTHFSSFPASFYVLLFFFIYCLR